MIRLVSTDQLLDRIFVKPADQFSNALMTPGRFFGRSNKTVQVPGFRFAEHTYGRMSCTPKHAHTLAHFCFVLNGVYEEQIHDKLYSRKSSMLMFLPPGVCHTEKHHSAVRSFLVEIDHWRYSSVREHNSFGDEPRLIQSRESLALMSKLYREFSQPDDWSLLSMEALSLEILALAGRQSTRRQAARPPKWLDRIKEMLHDEFVNPPSLTQLANAVDVNPSHVARVFRLHVGVTIGQYVRHMRIDHGKRLLEKTSVSLAEIAHRCGFADQAHFSNSFRRVVAMTPTEFRRRSTAGE